MLIVKKYGGSSVSTPQKIKAIAERIREYRKKNHQVVVIVSAMGDTTDHLLELSREITHTPVQRELDMLLSSGERISMALMAMALNSIGCPAISFTGSQSGVFTDGSHNNARIRDIKPIRLDDVLRSNKVIIVAGFQGVNPDTKEVTTLGRGGSDTTAVALAIRLKAESCHIHTDVKGLYTIDPRIPGVEPHALPKLDYEATLEMAYWGARVLHYRCVELAERHDMPLVVCLSTEDEQNTRIENMEHIEFRAINYLSPVASLDVPVEDIGDALNILDEGLKSQSVPWPQILHQCISKDKVRLFLTAPSETYDSIFKALQFVCQKQGLGAPVMKQDFGSVSVTGRGFNQTDAAVQAVQALKKANLSVEALVTSPLSFSFILPMTQVQSAAQVLHRSLVEKPS